MATHSKNTNSKTENEKKKISKDINIAELVNKHPEVVEMLTYEWGFHCINCIISNIETLEQGAATHGIIGEDFEIMLEMINDMLIVSEE